MPAPYRAATSLAGLLSLQNWEARGRHYASNASALLKKHHAVNEAPLPLKGRSQGRGKHTANAQQRAPRSSHWHRSRRWSCRSEILLATILPYTRHHLRWMMGGGSMVEGQPREVGILIFEGVEV